MTVTTESDFENLSVEKRGAITLLFIDRPKVLNALNAATLAEIGEFTRSFVNDDAQSALIVTGAGDKSFISGADINELAPLGSREAEDVSRFGQSVVDGLECSTKPVIAAINGYAFGGGFELALGCHMRLASDNAVMGLPEVGLGIIPGYGGTQRLPRLVGPGIAAELIMSGRRVKAEEAARLGIVNRVVAQADLLAEAEELAQSILKNGPLAVAAALECVQRGMQLPLDQGLRFESGRFGYLAASKDMHEGLNAFLEKRPPDFKKH